MRTAAGRAHARVALAGNPSDGYGGAVLATVVRDFAASVTAAPADADDCDGELLAATAHRFATAPVRLRCATTVPRQVGLAGSSAIVIAALRALCELQGEELHADELAARALAVEIQELGIHAGPQDRVVQSYDGLVAMDFAGGAHEPLDPSLLPPLFVAYRRSGSAPSGAFHGTLRARHDAGDARVRAGMAELAGLARTAAAAVRDGDHDALGRCMTASFDVRARIAELDPHDVALIDTARAHGVPANYAGSGGAVVGIRPDDDLFAKLRRAYETRGCAVIPISPAGPAPRRSS